MTKEEQGQCCLPNPGSACCCKVEALVGIDERGQMVLPKEIRDRANIHAGDKLAVISWEKDGKACCLSLVKADNLTGMVKNMLGPIMESVLQK